MNWKGPQALPVSLLCNSKQSSPNISVANKAPGRDGIAASPLYCGRQIGTYQTSLADVSARIRRDVSAEAK
jgi:hypothetical protein